MRGNLDRDTRGSALQVAEIAFPTVPGSTEVSRGGNFEGHTFASAYEEAPVAFPLAPGFIEVSVHGNFDLHAGPVNVSISAVACPFLPREVRKMAIVRNLDFGAGFYVLLVAAVALPVRSQYSSLAVLIRFARPEPGRHAASCQM